MCRVTSGGMFAPVVQNSSGNEFDLYIYIRQICVLRPLTPLFTLEVRLFGVWQHPVPSLQGRGRSV